MNLTTRNYTDLSILVSFKARYAYLCLDGMVGETTFGYDRYLNQMFYTSRKWKQVRDLVIIRDNGCDLGVIDYPIGRTIVIHHMNPMRIEDIQNGSEKVFDPEFLISTSPNTHKAIHYGDSSLLPQTPVERYPGDTTLWKKNLKNERW